MLRITFFSCVPNMSGGVRVVATYARELTGRGHEVTVISTPEPPVPFSRRMGSLLAGNGWPNRWKKRPSHLNFAGVREIFVDPWVRINADEIPDADAVIATWWETAAWVRDLPASKGRKFYFMQDYGQTPGQPLDKIRETWSFGLRTFTISRFLRDLVIDSVPQDVEVIPNAVDHNIFRAPERSKQVQPSVGFLYSRAPEKGTRDCIAAIRIARREIPAIRVFAFGPERLLPDLPLPEGTNYRCNVPDAELPTIYASCDAWLFGTHREGFGLPILEAMACRTPVIATPAGAAVEMLAAGGGVLVPRQDPGAMAVEILRFARMGSDEWSAISAAGQKAAAGWTWTDATIQLEKLLQR